MPTFTSLKTQTKKLDLHLTEIFADERHKANVKIPQVLFYVDDIDVAFNHIKESKVHIMRKIFEYGPTRFVFNFEDPDRNPLACESTTRRVSARI